MARTSKSPTSPSWTGVKRLLAHASPAELMKLLRELYDLSPENRRFLQARFLSPTGEIDVFRRQIRDALWPDAFSRRPASIAAAKRVIHLYARATGDEVGTLDLRLTFLEYGTAYAVDVGLDDERYFDSLMSMVDQVVGSLGRMPAEAAEQFHPRLAHLLDRGSHLGWGYGDYLQERLAAVLS